MRIPSGLIAAVLVVLSGCTTPPSPDLAAEKAALHARMEGVVAAEAAFNVPEVLTYWAEGAIMQPAGSPQIEGKDAIRELLSQYFESGLVREFSGSSSHMELSAGGDLLRVRRQSHGFGRRGRRPSGYGQVPGDMEEDRW